MNAVNKLIVVLAVSVPVGACGFKSDLTIPDSKASSDDLFVSDTELAAELEDRPPFLPNEADGVEVMTDGLMTDDDIVIEKVTTAASDGKILISPDDAEVDVEVGVDVGVEVETAADDESEGVPVDFSELTEQLESDTQAQ